MLVVGLAQSVVAACWSDPSTSSSACVQHPCCRAAGFRCVPHARCCNCAGQHRHLWPPWGFGRHTYNNLAVAAVLLGRASQNREPRPQQILPAQLWQSLCIIRAASSPKPKLCFIAQWDTRAYGCYRSQPAFPAQSTRSQQASTRRALRTSNPGLAQRAPSSPYPCTRQPLASEPRSTWCSSCSAAA